MATSFLDSFVNMINDCRAEELKELSSYALLKLIEIDNKNRVDPSKKRRLTDFEYEAWARGLYGTRRNCVLNRRMFDRNSDKCKCCRASDVCFLYP